MSVKELNNIVIQYGDGIQVLVDDGIVVSDDKFKASILIDNVMVHYYKLYKLGVETVGEGDVLLTLYSEVTRISSNILLPSGKKVVVVVNDFVW